MDFLHSLSVLLTSSTTSLPSISPISSTVSLTTSSATSDAIFCSSPLTSSFITASVTSSPMSVIALFPTLLKRLLIPPLNTPFNHLAIAPIGIKDTPAIILCRKLSFS